MLLISFTLNLTIIKNFAIKGIFILLIGLALYFTFPLALEISLKDVLGYLTQTKVAANISIVLIIESVLGIMMSVFLLNDFYIGRKNRIANYLLYFPGLFIFPASFLLQAFLLTSLPGMRFETLQWVFSLIIPLTIVLF
jgi:hypothetical protein